MELFVITVPLLLLHKYDTPSLNEDVVTHLKRAVIIHVQTVLIVYLPSIFHCSSLNIIIMIQIFV